MGELKVQFQGICVNFRQSFNPLLPVEHRVVLVNASHFNSLAGELIPPHFASLQAPGITVPLGGCTLRVSNALPTTNVYDPDYDTLPNLTELMLSGGPAPKVLGPPSLPMLLGENPYLAACYFDVNSGGHFSSCLTPMGSAQTTLSVDTDGDPLLELIPFPLSPHTQPENGVFTFPPGTTPSGTTVTIQNAASPEGETEDSEFHFYLSYLTAATFPDSPELPTGLSGPPCGPEALVGPGCSDSNYP